MPTITTGTFFLARKPFDTDSDAQGNFRLTLRAIDRQAPGRAESYVLTWTGPAAAIWFNANREALQPGRGIQVEVHNPRSLPGRIAPETHATVARCSLAALAPSWVKHETTLQQAAA